MTSSPLSSSPISSNEAQHRMLANPRLPLAVYREVAAHLEQIPGVTAQLNSHPPAQFDYQLSQVRSLEIHYSANLEAAQQQRLEEILAHYSQRFGIWERL
jgi:hypothetical protein